MKFKNKRTFSVNRADPDYRRTELSINKVRIAISLLLFAISILLVVTDIVLPIWVYVFFVVVLFATPAILRRVLHKKSNLNTKGSDDE